MNYVSACHCSELPHQTRVCEASNKSENTVYHVCLQAANSNRRSLESEVKIRTSAMESFDQMNSSLISANISLQVRNQCHWTCEDLLHDSCMPSQKKLGLTSKRSFLCRNPSWRTVRTEWTGEMSWRVCGAPVRKHKKNSETRRGSWLPHRLKTRLWGYRYTYVFVFTQTLMHPQVHWDTGHAAGVTSRCSDDLLRNGGEDL